MHDTIQIVVVQCTSDFRFVPTSTSGQRFDRTFVDITTPLELTMEVQGDGNMEFGENDVFIAMEEGDLDGEELDDLDDADPAGTPLIFLAMHTT